MRTILCALFFAVLGLHSMAQMAVDGLKFSACVNKPDLQADFYKNKFLVLDFWATWCGPCIGSFPDVKKLEAKYKSNANIVFATMTPETRGKIDTFFIKKKGIMPDALHLIDDHSATWTNFDINNIPQILVFSPAGKLVFRGEIEHLSKVMSKLLKGDVLLQEAQKPTASPDNWKKYRERADYLAIVSSADSGGVETGGSTRHGDKVEINFTHSELVGVVSSVGGITETKIQSNKKLRLKEKIMLFYKQTKNNFPEFDKGIFPKQYQNHILSLLEHTYSFHSEWIRVNTSAWEIVVKDAAKWEENATISTAGSFANLIDRKKHKTNFVNQMPKTFAEFAEDYLGVFVYSNIESDHGYDLILEFSSIDAFKKSLASYGLALKKDNNYEVKKLNLIFD
jgi:thiol-disulfide isomerase/thioredoxin